MKFPVKVLEPYFADVKLVIVTGHFGSGKTEFSVNFALRAAEVNERFALADLDIVNPYFLSREKAEIFKEKGIELISSGDAALSAGLGSLPSEIYSLTEDPNLFGIVDTGGDPNGARVLASFADRVEKVKHKMLYVLNANRPETSTVKKAVSYLRLIEKAGHVKADGIVNNTHLCGETDEESVLKGAALAKEVSRAVNLPIVCHTAPSRLAGSKKLEGLPIMPIDVYMKKPWE